MIQSDLFDFYVDYLIYSSGHVSATGLSRVHDGDFSHDQVSRMLDSKDLAIDSKTFWKQHKKLVREVQNPSGVLILDDFIVEKPHSKENSLITWHYSHQQGRKVKGINIVHLLYSVSYGGKMVDIPVGFELVHKNDWKQDAKTGKQKRVSKISKNEIGRNLLKRATHLHHIPFEYVLADSWYCSAENMRFIKQKLGKDFVMAIKTNRKVALTKGKRKYKEFVKLTDLNLEVGKVWEVWLEDVPFPVYISKEVYPNKDGSTGTLFLVTSKKELEYQQIIGIYQIRWRIESAHKSLKNNTSLAASPTKTLATQTRHIFASFYAFVKIEAIKIKTKLNHFALKNKMYIKALKAAKKELAVLEISSFRA